MKIWFIEEPVGRKICSYRVQIRGIEWKITVYDTGTTLRCIDIRPNVSIKLKKKKIEPTLLDLRYIIDNVDPKIRIRTYYSTKGRNITEEAEKRYEKLLKKKGIENYREIARLIVTLLYIFPILPLLYIPEITDIFIRRGRYIMIESINDIIGRAITTWYADDKLIDMIFNSLACRCGIYPTMYNPLISVTDPELGVRISVVSEDVSLYEPFIGIRALPKRPWLPTDLIQRETVTPELIALLGFAMRNKVPLIVFGETGAGKTTLLSTVAQYLPIDARIVLIQDIKEIKLALEERRTTIIDLATRTKIAQGIREITWEELFTQALRLTPDYILIPEVRGKETRWLIEAFMTGHGGGTTIHAESPHSVKERLDIHLRETGITTQDLHMPIILVKIGKEMEIRNKTIIPKRKVTNAWILKKGELILIYSNSLYIDQAKRELYPYITKLRTTTTEKLDLELRKLTEITLQATKIAKKKKLNEITWVQLLNTVTQ